MAAQFVTSDSEHDSEGASPVHVHQPAQSSPLRHAKSTPGQIFNNNDINNDNNDSKTFSNPFDDFGDEDPFADNKPNNPFNNPFADYGNNKPNLPKNYKSKDNNRRTDTTTQQVKEKRSKTPEPEMPPIKFNTNHNKNNQNANKATQHNRRHSQPINSFNPNINLDDIFSDFQPQSAFRAALNENNQQPPPKLPPKTNASLSLAPNTLNKDKKRSKSVFMARNPSQYVQKNNTGDKRRGSINKNQHETELAVALKTGYDIGYFVDRDVAYKYLCIICENVCRSAVELTCKKKRHLCCEYCVKKYFDIHGNKCPIHPEHINLKYSTSKYITYHIQSLKVKCPYSTSNGIHGGCGWIDNLKNLDKHQVEHTQFIRCPFADYGCKTKLKIDENKIDSDSDQTLKQHLIHAQAQHLILLLKKTNQLNNKLTEKTKIINTMHKQQRNTLARVQYLNKISRISDDNIWILCGSHKFWKHKYNQLFTVNLQNECRTQIRIYDISRVSNNKQIQNTNKSSEEANNTVPNNSSTAAVYDPTQSDSWDVGDLGVAHVNNTFNIPIWLMKKYPNLDVFNRDRLDSIIFRCGGHLIRDKKVTARCDAILLDNHYLSNSNYSSASVAHSAIPMQQLIGYKLNCFPNLPSKRYNCECVYSQRHGLVVVGGSGVDKNQINFVNQLKIRDQDVNITYNNRDDNKSNSNSNKSYPMNSTFNITLEWKNLAPILRAREDTAMCLFNDRNILGREYVIICGGWSNGCLRTSELYNFEANKWINLAPMHVKHNAAGICEWTANNSVVIVGGFNTEAHFSAEYFELVKQKWIKLPNTNYKHRYKPAVWIKNVSNPQIICCAGSGVLKNEVGTVEYLDTRDNKWSTVKKPLSSLLGLGANINANNWRMWRIFT